MGGRSGLIACKWLALVSRGRQARASVGASRTGNSFLRLRSSVDVDGNGAPLVALSMISFSYPRTPQPASALAVSATCAPATVHP